MTTTRGWSSGIAWREDASLADRDAHRREVSRRHPATLRFRLTATARPAARLRRRSCPCSGRHRAAGTRWLRRRARLAGPRDVRPVARRTCIWPAVAIAAPAAARRTPARHRIGSLAARPARAESSAPSAQRSSAGRAPAPLPWRPATRARARERHRRRRDHLHGAVARRSNREAWSAGHETEHRARHQRDHGREAERGGIERGFVEARIRDADSGAGTRAGTHTPPAGRVRWRAPTAAGIR